MCPRFPEGSTMCRFREASLCKIKDLRYNLVSPFLVYFHHKNPSIHNPFIKACNFSAGLRCFDNIILKLSISLTVIFFVSSSPKVCARYLSYLRISCFKRWGFSKNFNVCQKNSCILKIIVLYFFPKGNMQ